MLLLCWQMIDVLCCELDVAHRYFEGKYEALKILQGKVEPHITAYSSWVNFFGLY